MNSKIIEGKTEFELALLVSNIIERKTDFENFRLSYAAFVDQISEELAASKSVERFLEAYRKTGLVQEKQVSMELWHSDILRVFDSKEGIPITLGILLIETANRCGFQAKGVNYPGHFLVSLNDDLVDPMSLLRLDPEKFENADTGSESLLVPVEPLIVLLRMLNNLRALYIRAETWIKAVEMIDLQIDISAHNNRLKASLIFDKGELWSKMEAYGLARQCFLEAAEFAEDSGFVDQCQARIIELSRSDQVLH
ncbi:hypothetical protein OAL14_08815 [Gammaproteobacteria bacterium]|nr:hypothetical protein [Gammaproteobacteria bacterium]